MVQTRRLAFCPRKFVRYRVRPNSRELLRSVAAGFTVGKEIVMSSPAPAMKFENILYEKKGPIAYVTLNRPQVLNALSQAVFSELKAAFEDARDDANVRSVILTGSGDKAFAAGADIAEMSSYTAAQGEEATRRAQGVTELIENLAN